MRATEDSVEGRSVNGEHDKCPTRNDSDEVVPVTDYAFPGRTEGPRNDLGDRVLDGPLQVSNI